ncbi:MAG: hypothetical protein ACO3VR_03535, partial [Lutimaribacter sp.]
MTIAVTVGSVTLANDAPLTLISGPCQLESDDHAQMIAGTLQAACAAAGAQFIFKGSFDKANRTSLSGKRGLGLERGLAVLEGVKKALGVPVLTDIHEASQCAVVAQVADVLQIPQKADDFLQKLQQTRLFWPDFEEASCLYLIWKDPFMAAGQRTYIHDVLGQLNLRNA